ncbi:MAG: DUF2723 domain-containing protein [Chloroflexi bacterium]|nr:MAG: DUF2723 domain-containing protein [Chloroflexota bacterium]
MGTIGNMKTKWQVRLGYWVHTAVFSTLVVITTLTCIRLLYESLFPRWLWAGRPFPVVGLTLLVTIPVLIIHHRQSLAVTPFSPLLLNIFYLVSPNVNLVAGWLVLGGSVWLTAVLFWQRSPSPSSFMGVLWLWLALIPIYYATMPHVVGQADTFEFQVVAPRLGIVHPTGYPLYLLWSKLFTLLPFGTVAWRINAGTAVLALAACTILYLFTNRLLQHSLPALLTAVTFGLTPTFWSQAIEAEVYALHALVVILALWLMHQLLTATRRPEAWRTVYRLVFLIGLGLTNHLTTVFLLPPAAVTAWLAWRVWREPLRSVATRLPRLIVAFVLPLSLYAYLPLRWLAVNGEPMGASRFVDWVIGGRFQGALQWLAWLNDPARYAIIGRLVLAEWGWLNLGVAGVGLLALLWRNWRMTAVLLITWLGFIFYALNYYVPDLAVFIIPAHLVTAVFWAAGLHMAFRVLRRLWSHAGIPLATTLLLLPTLLAAARYWPELADRNDPALLQWGTAVLRLPIPQNAAILADSEKIAPLFYLQQAENVRPDLDIMVLPDEAAYRAELDKRVASGQPVFLARFLPGLEGVYHLRSLGPLTEVSREPLTHLPETAVPATLTFGEVRLLGYSLATEAATNPQESAVTLYWQATQPITQTQVVYVRWQAEDYTGQPDAPAGQHPANNYYPIAAWKGNEIVPDYHHWPRPMPAKPTRMALQVALGAPFTPANALNWQTVTEITLHPLPALPQERPYRLIVGNTAITGATFPDQIRPQQPLPITISGIGSAAELSLTLAEQYPPATPDLLISPTVTSGSFTWATELATSQKNGRYHLILTHPGQAAFCGWLTPPASGCSLGIITLSGVPLPPDAINFEDKIALLKTEIPETSLHPGGQFAVTFTWQALSPIAEDYTVFVQILDANDKLVGQVDAWPMQGTFPTSQWSPGEIITDPYVIQLPADLPPGEYRLQAGFYLLATLRRLPVVDANGTPVDDKVVIPGLIHQP